jgi:predicted transcriptional regulator YheO
MHSELKRFVPLVKTIAQMFGKNCEVVLHDFSEPQKSIVAIENGQVTGRKIGDSITDLALSIWRKGGYGKKKEDKIVNYRTKTKDGKILKSSTTLIRDDQKKIIGCLCINYDLTEYLMFNKIVGEFCTTIDLDKEKLKNETKNETETFSNNVDEVLENIIQEAIEKIGKLVSIMQKDDKLLIVKIVEEKGGFLIKGAIDQLAAEISVSRYTIYNYLDELKTKKKREIS